MGERMNIGDKVFEAEEAVKQLEDLKKRTENTIMRVKHFGMNGDGTFEKDKEALEFAIEFIRRGFGGKLL